MSLSKLNGSLMLTLIVLAVLALSACTAETLQVGVVPTATPTPLPTVAPTPTPGLESFREERYGFGFQYLSHWTLTSEPNLVVLSQGSLALRIGYRWTAEAIDITGGRTGMPAGDFIYGGKVSFLDQVIPAQVLEYERKDKMVLYNGTSPVQAGELVFGILLEDLDGIGYDELDIPKELQAEVLTILESFQRFEGTGTPPTPVPPPDLLVSYTNEEYGLSFRYPSSWTIQDQSARSVRLGQESLSLYIGFMRLHESVDITGGRTGLPAGELESRGVVTFLGQEVERQVLVYQGEERVVLYNGGEMIVAGDLAFVIYLDEFAGEVPAGIDPERQAEVDAMLVSFTVEPAAAPVTDLAVVGWYGSVHSTPEHANHDDYLAVYPEGTAEVGLVGASPAVEAMIVELRDKEPPSNLAHFWGTLNCGVSDYAGCQLVVTHLRPDGPGPLFDPDPVDGWEGTLITNSAWAQVDDALVLDGPYPVHYGVWSEDPALAAQLESYRNTGLSIRLWGQVLCGVMDANGCQIQVNRLEELGMPAPVP